jgi:hypothetical protein
MAEPPKSDAIGRVFGGLSVWAVFYFHSRSRGITARGWPWSASRGSLGQLAEMQSMLVVHGMPPPRSIPVLSLLGGLRPAVASIRLEGRSDETSGHAASHQSWRFRGCTTQFLTHSIIIWWFAVCLQRPAQMWD